MDESSELFFVATNRFYDFATDRIEQHGGMYVTRTRDVSADSLQHLFVEIQCGNSAMRMRRFVLQWEVNGAAH